jgi:hypothetical protein
MILNVVFDKWDENNKPIKNLEYLFREAVESGRSIDELDMETDWKLNECKLTDITSDENYYYIISHIYTYLHFLKNGKLILPIEVEECITHNNLKVIFMAPHESPEHLDIFVKMLTDTINKNNWKESNFYIINNNAMIYNVKNKLNSNINFFKINALLKLVSNIKIKTTESDILYNKKFIFLCLNNRSHNHRVLLLTHLKHLNLLKDDIIDWSLVEKYNTNVVQSIKHLKGYIEPTNKILVNDYKIITSTKKISYYEQNVNWFDSYGNINPYKHLTLDSYKNSYINIVTESHYNFIENDVHITEKSFIPFYYFQLPIFLSRPNHIKMMKEEYDFYFFDDLIDHSYDNEIDDVKRFHMVVDEIKRLSSMKEKISTYYKNNIDKLIHNHNFIKTYSEKKVEENYFLNLINENK